MQLKLLRNSLFVLMSEVHHKPNHVYHMLLFLLPSIGFQKQRALILSINWLSTAPPKAPPSAPGKPGVLPPGWPAWSPGRSALSSRLTLAPSRSRDSRFGGHTGDHDPLPVGREYLPGNLCGRPLFLPFPLTVYDGECLPLFGRGALPFFGGGAMPSFNRASYFGGVFWRAGKSLLFKISFPIDLSCLDSAVPCTV